MLLRPLNLFILLLAGMFVYSCSSGNGMMSMFSGNPARDVQVALKDGNAKQLRSAWENKAASLCKSGYDITNLGKAVSTAGGHNSLSGTISCK